MLEKVKETLAPYAEVKTYAGEYTFIVPRQHIRTVMQALKGLGFDYLVDIGATDLFVEGERYEVFYNLFNLSAGIRIRVKCQIPESDPVIDSITDIYPAANWHEREAWDMMGIRFTGHPDLRRIYLPEDFAYYPLRKDFPLLGIPGSLPLPE